LTLLIFCLSPKHNTDLSALNTTKRFKDMDKQNFPMVGQF